MHFNLPVPPVRVNRREVLNRNAHFSRSRVRAQQSTNNPQILRAHDIAVLVPLLRHIHAKLTQTHRIRLHQLRVHVAQRIHINIFL